ncbi:MAG: RcnB family protein [Pseudoxanthomonas sp.]
MKCSSALALVLGLAISGSAFAGPHDRHHDRRDDRRDRHGHYDDRDRRDHRRGPPPHARAHDRGYRRGDRYQGRGYAVDYRRHHLAAPPRGHEWRRDGDKYLMVAVATGIIASVIAASN